MDTSDRIVLEWETHAAFIKIREDKVIDYYLKDNVLVSLQDQKEVSDSMVEKLGNVRMYPMLVTLGEFANMSPDASKYARSTEVGSPVLCVAIITKNIAQRMIGNFYYIVFKPSFPYRLFNTREEAISWLKKTYLHFFPLEAKKLAENS